MITLTCSFWTVYCAGAKPRAFLMVLGYLGEDNQRAFFFKGQTEHFKSLKKLNDPDWIEIEPLEV